MNKLNYLFLVVLSASSAYAAQMSRSQTEANESLKKLSALIETRTVPRDKGNYPLVDFARGIVAQSDLIKGPQGGKLLLSAAKNHYFGLVKYLLQNGADPLFTDDAGHTLEFYLNQIDRSDLKNASHFANISDIRKMMGKKIQMKERVQNLARFREAFTTYASSPDSRGFVYDAQKLLTKDPGILGDLWKTTLYAGAAELGLVKFLLLQGADVFATDAEGHDIEYYMKELKKTPLIIANKQALYKEVMDLIQKAKDARNAQAKLEAAEAGRVLGVTERGLTNIVEEYLRA